MGAFQECTADRHSRTAQHRHPRTTAVRGRRQNDGGARGGTVEDTGDRPRNDDGNERDGGQPVRRDADPAAAAVSRGSPGSSRVERDPEMESSVDAREPTPDQDDEERPKRDRWKPKKLNDYVLY